AQLEAVRLADRQRQFQRVDRVQSKAVAEQRRFRIDSGGRDVLQVQAVDQQLRQGGFGRALYGHRAGSGKMESATIRHAAASCKHGATATPRRGHYRATVIMVGMIDSAPE